MLIVAIFWTNRSFPPTLNVQIVLKSVLYSDLFSKLLHMYSFLVILHSFRLNDSTAVFTHDRPFMKITSMRNARQNFVCTTISFYRC
jgi:hypothetical protein